MKIKVFCSVLAIVPFAMVQAINAQPGPTVIITADENGVGTIDFVAGGVAPIPMPGIMTPDGLFYNMGVLPVLPPIALPGDVLLLEPPIPVGTQALLSDVIRFGQGPLGAGFYFYSDNNDGIDNLADIIGLPTTLLPDQAVIPEGLLYTPTPNEPGFVPGFVVEYKFDSDIPDGGVTVGLLGMGLCGLMALTRRLKK